MIITGYKIRFTLFEKASTKIVLYHKYVFGGTRKLVQLSRFFLFCFCDEQVHT